MSVECPECKKVFETNRKLQRFCSVRCRGNYNARAYRIKNRDKVNYSIKLYRARNAEKIKQRSRKHPPFDKVKNKCLVCGKVFKSKDRFHPIQKYCGKECRKKANYFDTNYKRELDTTKINTCMECGKTFHPVRNKPFQRFCERKCRNRFKGRKYPKPGEREPTTCVVCGREINSLSKFKPFLRYCSKKCLRHVVQVNYYQRHRKKELEEVKRYRKTKRGKYLHRLNAQRYAYTKRAKLGGSIYIPRQDLEFIKKRDKACVYCGSKKYLVNDHIIPIHSGGTNKKENLVRACRSCNSSRRHIDVSKWCERKGRPVPKIILKLLAEQKLKKRVI